jgi:hypothetical protein
MVAEAILATLRPALNQLGQPWALAGRVAVSAWYHLRTTKVLDFVVGIGEKGIEQLLECFQRRGLHAKRHPPVLQIADQRIIQYLFEPPGTFLDIQVDLIVAETEYQRAALTRRIALRFPEIKLTSQSMCCLART